MGACAEKHAEEPLRSTAHLTKLGGGFGEAARGQVRIARHFESLSGERGDREGGSRGGTRSSENMERAAVLEGGRGAKGKGAEARPLPQSRPFLHNPHSDNGGPLAKYTTDLI